MLVILILGLTLLALLASAWLKAAPPLVRCLLYLEQRRNGLYSAYQQAGGLRFHYLHSGWLHNNRHQNSAALNTSHDSRPLLLLLHGFGGDTSHWLSIAPYLSSDYRLLIPDLPGFGATPFPANSAADQAAAGNMEAQADRVAVFLDALGITEKAYVAGNSMGGYLAAVLAQRHPQRVGALWLMNPGGVHAAELTELIQTIADGGSNQLIPESLEAFRHLREKVFVKQPLLPTPIARSIVRRCRQRKALFTYLFHELCYNSEPLDDFAPRLGCPVLLVWGDHDQVLHPSGCAILAAKIALAETILMPNMGHCPMLEAPAACARDFKRFVNSHDTNLTTAKAAVHH